MKTNGDKSSPRDRLNDFLDRISPLKNETQSNDAPIEKSRWAMWQLNTDSGENKPAFRQIEKSESKLFNRLFDRLDPSAGKARHAARREIMNLLEANGIEVTTHIKMHLPDTRKLGNLNTLGKSIQEAIENKEKQLEKNIVNKFKGNLESRIKNNTFNDLLKMENIFSDDEDILVSTENYLKNEMHETVKKLADDISKSISDARTKYNQSNTNPEYVSGRSIRTGADRAGFEGAQKMFTDEFSKILPGEKFQSLAIKLSSAVDEVINNNAATDNSIDQGKIDQLKEKIVQSLLISSFMKSLSQELAKKPIIGVIPIKYLSSSAEKLIANNNNSLDLKTFESSAKFNRNFNQKDAGNIFQNMTSGFNFPSAYSELQQKLKSKAVPK
jgi:hypothetical protein